MALTYEDVYEYVGIEAEYADDIQRRRAERALKAADMWLTGAVGKRRDLEDPYEWKAWPLAEETMLMAAGEMYENRNLVDVNLSKYAGSKAAASLNRLAFDSISQLRFCDPPVLPEEPTEPEEPADGEPGPDEPDDGESEETHGGDGECPSETP